MIIHMISYCQTDLRVVKVPKPSQAEDKEQPGNNSGISLPQTLVCISIESQTEAS